MNERRAFFREVAAAAIGVKQAAEEAMAQPPERYARQLEVPGWGPEAQRLLAASSVLVIGAGALGSPVALYLAGAGVGRLGVVDPAEVELSGLFAQLLHFTPDAGIAKAQSAAAKLGFLNPEIRVEPYQARFAPAMLEGQDLVVDCTGGGFALNDACCAAGVPLVVAAAAGPVMTVLPGRSACWRCAHDAPPPRAAVLGPVAGVVGSLMALEALRVLGGLEPRLAGARLTLDSQTLSTQRESVQRDPRCAACAPVP